MNYMDVQDVQDRLGKIKGPDAYREFIKTHAEKAFTYLGQPLDGLNLIPKGHERHAAHLYKIANYFGDAEIRFRGERKPPMELISSDYIMLAKDLKMLCGEK
jgi:hypothetical protein